MLTNIRGLNYILLVASIIGPLADNRFFLFNYGGVSDVALSNNWILYLSIHLCVCHHIGGEIMANRDDLGFMFSFISLVSSAGDALQELLRHLPAVILAWIIVLTIIWYVISHVFKLLFKDKQPVQLGPIKLSYATMLSALSMVVVFILLLL